MCDGTGLDDDGLTERLVATNDAVYRLSYLAYYFSLLSTGLYFSRVTACWTDTSNEFIGTLEPIFHRPRDGAVSKPTPSKRFYV